MAEEFSTVGFVKAIPGMIRKVWPGFWVVIVAVTLCLYFDNPTGLDVLTVSEWLSLHALVVIGMITTTIWLYCTYERPAVNMAVIGLWLLASGGCVLSDFLLKLITGSGG